MKPLVILDCGHGGVDPSTGLYTTIGKKKYYFTNHDEHIYEGYWNRVIGVTLEAELKARGFNVIYAAHGYHDTSLHYRVHRSANPTLQDTGYTTKNVLYLSIHNNAARPKVGESKLEGTGRTAYGTEFYTYKGKGKSFQVATNIMEAIANDVPERRLRKNWKTRSLVKQANFYVLKQTVMPAVLGEFWFFDNWDEVQQMKDPVFRGRMVTAVANGIAESYGL